ncbi:M24 family metallopeptidase [Alicyclobacillus sp. ALC3]|uniref:M24 family metallopeptidase n=1 Tax=Alicyclobacillus sp. ALC3 TaxID=2796143 RepID=UPI002378EDF2|nr:Xaa-Pro peptidase family protein [Alicyclobacillus sp. ALC3]WDL97015.1 aminopeptidase P family protein [Alicyclobacillus sp. ALC3]
MTEQRIKNLQALLSDQGLDAMLVSSPENRRYLSGFTGSAGSVLVTPNRAWMIVDFRYLEQVQVQCKGLEVIRQGDTVADTLRDVIEQEHLGRVGLEDHALSHRDARQFLNLEKTVTNLRIVSAGGLVEQLRTRKDITEVDTIRKAAQIADAGFEHILSVIRPGVTEIEVAFELETFMRRQGASHIAFDTIVASGWRGAWPHGVASDKLLASGELVTLDFGAVVDGYCSDITRTVCIGEPTTEQRSLYDHVLESQVRALHALRVGMTGREADAVARSYLSDHGLGEAFGHSLGHGLGLEVHEAPRLSKVSDDILTEGMVVTIEPGAYLPQFGGVRIEDDVWFTPDGNVEILTHAPKQLICL